MGMFQCTYIVVATVVEGFARVILAAVRARIRAHPGTIVGAVYV